MGFVHDPDGMLGHGLPPDRKVHLLLTAEVLTWTAVTAPPADGMDLAALELTGHARVVREELAQRVRQLPLGSELGELLGYTLEETARRISVASSALGILAHVQSRARMVEGLYRSLNRLEQPPGVRLPAQT
ncbi:restriction endonuclease [Streptomyces sp. NBC_00503]|uniref:restriction endonuclease n=1 Tax=Streptomyces sp. NBC_00503 TaxID=2903659 RepID=UPI002E81EBAC|nr:restriction endonuclease [Streptomyces sp. NBC_00503]WUD79130.1 restriction endonuclease [Streptomyces sp. NBC_00503]